MKSKVGWVLSLLISIMLLFSASVKFSGSEEAMQNMQHLGIDPGLLKGLAVLEVLAALLFVVPRTALIGAILITGWMGGALFAHLRVGDPFFIQIVLPIVVWIAFGLRHFADMMPLLGMRRPR